MTTEFQPLSILGTDRVYNGRWRLVGEVLEMEIEGRTYHVRSEGDLITSVKSFLKKCGRRVFHDRMRLKACGTCKHFDMSSMARDMGRGQRGMCLRHGWGVEICFLCDDFEEEQRP